MNEQASACHNNHDARSHRKKKKIVRRTLNTRTHSHTPTSLYLMFGSLARLVLVVE